MKKISALLAFILIQGMALSQTTVFTDDFNRGSVVTPLSNGGTPTMTWTTSSTISPTGISSTNLNSGSDYNFFLSNNTGTPAAGRTYVTGALSTFSSPYNTTLSNNSGIVTWTFNMKTNRSTALSGFDAANYGSAVALVATSSDLMAANGYAVILVKGTTNNAVKLVSFTGGLDANSNLTTIIGPSSDLGAMTRWASVKVTYNPSSNNWQLFFRDDASTSDPTDPATGTLTQVGSTTANSTYVSDAMTHCGFFYDHGGTATPSNNRGYYDNFKVTVTPGPTTIAQLTTGIASSPLTAGATNKAVLGFSLTTANGSVNFSAINVQTSTTSVSKFTNIKLYTSTDNSYATAGDNTQVSSVSVNQTSSEIQLSGFSSSVGTSGKNYFVVTDIDNSVTGSTTAVQPSFSEANITVSEGTKNAATITGTNYSFESAAAPVITVTGSLSGFGNVVTGTNSPEQTYTVEAANLTEQLAVTAPSGFQVSTTSGSGFSSSLNLAGPTVSTTTIYVRFSPSSDDGAHSGNITNASTGATTRNVAVSGTALSTEPTTQSSITFGTVTSGSIVVNFSGGNGGNRVVIARSGSAVSYTPGDASAVSGTNNDFSAASDLGSGNKCVYDGTGGTVTVSGLGGNTTYHFAVYEYNRGTGTSQNYLGASPGTGNQTTDAVVYTWDHSTSTDWTVADNWTPSRSTPGTTDVLQFNEGGSLTITNVPTQTIGQLQVSNNTTLTVQSGAAGNTLTISGGTGTDFEVASGSTCNIDGANALGISLNTGTTGAISGNVTFTGAAHTLKSADASGITFQSGAVFTAGTGFSGNAFGTTNLNSVVFSDGSTYVQSAGSNPFGASAPNSVLTFQAGSLFKFNAATGNPSYSGRTYANVEIDNAAYNNSATGSGTLTMNNLSVTNGTQNLNLNGGVVIKGDISVAGGASLGFSATSGTLTLNGAAAQSISGTGTLTLAPVGGVIINNSTGIALNREVTVGSNITLTSGKVDIGSNILILSASTAISGTPSASNMIIADGSGEVRKVFTGNGAFTFPIGDNTGTAEYSPVTVTLNSNNGLSSAYIAAKVSDAKHPNNSATNSYISRYWTVTQSGITSPNYDIALTYTDADITGTETSLYGGKYTGSGNIWTGLGSVDADNNRIAVGGLTSFSDFSAMELGALPVELTSFVSRVNGREIILEWKTATEVNSSLFVIEQSKDKNTWERAGTVDASGYSNAPRDYSFIRAAGGKGEYYFRLKMVDNDGAFEYSGIIQAEVTAPSGFALRQNYPNPFNPATRISFDVPAESRVVLEIFNTLGQKVQTAVDGVLAGDYHTADVRPGNLSAGTYYYRIAVTPLNGSPGYTAVRKMIFLK